MTRFAYHGVDKAGAAIAGEVESQTAEEVVRMGKAEGHVYYSVRRADSTGIFSRAERPLKIEDLNLFAAQLGSLTASGVPLASALGELSRELGRGRLCRILDEVRSDVEGGSSLEASLARHGDAIPSLYCSLVRVGERTGNLPEVLLQLAQFGQRFLWFRYRLQIAVAYPAVLSVLSLLFLGVFVPNVISQFEDIYASYGRELPWITASVLALGRGLLYGGVPAFFAIVLASVLVRLQTRGRGYKAPWDRIKLALPLIGPIYQSVISARFFRALSLLLLHGAPITESLHLAGLASGSSVLFQAAQGAAQNISGGVDVSDALDKTGVLRRTHCWMLRQGERNGNFPEMLARLADSCDLEAERLEQASLARVGPALVVVCGVLIGYFVVACFVPIFQFPGFIGD